MVTVFFQGSFDILNAGHCRSFTLAKAQGDYLVVGLNSDRIIREDKGREAIVPFAQRKEILETLRPVDTVIECDGIYALPYLQALDARVFVTIDEWKERQAEAIAWVMAQGGSIFTPPYFPHNGTILSSTMIRQRVIEGAK